jgi:hypothetical protein
VQDRVPAFSPEKAKAFIEKEMGCPIEVVYKEFDNRPIAAASLGQVLSFALYQNINLIFSVPISVYHTISPFSQGFFLYILLVQFLYESQQLLLVLCMFLFQVVKLHFTICFSYRIGQYFLHYMFLISVYVNKCLPFLLILT